MYFATFYHKLPLNSGSSAGVFMALFMRQLGQMSAHLNQSLIKMMENGIQKSIITTITANPKII